MYKSEETTRRILQMARISACHVMPRLINSRALLVALVLFFLLIPLSFSHSANFENDIDEEKVAEVKNLRNLISQSRFSFLSEANLHLRISPEIQSLVKAAELDQSSVNLIVNLHDEFCEAEIRKRAGSVSSGSRRSVSCPKRQLRTATGTHC